MSENTKMPLKCSFCGKSAKQVEKLIAGPSVFICNECVALCQLYIDHPENTKGKLLLDEDLKPVLRNGQPVFVPVTEEESQVFRDRYDLA